jgi:hypothetical protein
MGSEAATDSYLRLFKIPGITYGVETGSGAGRIVNFYDYIQDWAEKSIAPDFLVGGKYNNTGYSSSNSEELLYERKHWRYPYALTGMGESRAKIWGSIEV